MKIWIYIKRLLSGYKTAEDIKIAYARMSYEDTGKYFSIGQIYDDKNAEIIRCSKCKSEKFNVAVGSHYTAIRCVKFKKEINIHDG